MQPHPCFNSQFYVAWKELFTDPYPVCWKANYYK